jgi:hypothetical protein
VYFVVDVYEYEYEYAYEYVYEYEYAYDNTNAGDFELAWMIDTPDGPCDTSTVDANADDAGDCELELASGESCTNNPSPGFVCAPSTCLNGNLAGGACGGICSSFPGLLQGCVTAALSVSPLMSHLMTTI